MTTDARIFDRLRERGLVIDARMKPVKVGQVVADWLSGFGGDTVIDWDPIETAGLLIAQTQPHGLDRGVAEWIRSSGNRHGPEIACVFLAGYWSTGQADESAIGHILALTEAQDIGDQALAASASALSWLIEPGRAEVPEQLNRRVRASLETVLPALRDAGQCPGVVKRTQDWLETYRLQAPDNTGGA